MRGQVQAAGGCAAAGKGTRPWGPGMCRRMLCLWQCLRAWEGVGWRQQKAGFLHDLALSLDPGTAWGSPALRA